MSKKGSSVLVTGLFRRLRQRKGGGFRIIFLIVGPKCGRIGCRAVLGGTGVLGVPVAIFQARVFSAIISVASSPYCLYTQVHEKCLCDGTQRLKYGGVTLKRRFSSIVRAVIVKVLCNTRVRAVVPGLRDAGFRKVRLVHPLCLIERTSVVR